jgi:hypothetical protein
MYLIYPNNTFLLEVKHYHYFYKYYLQHYNYAYLNNLPNREYLNMEALYLLFMISTFVSIITCITCISQKKKQITDKSTKKETKDDLTVGVVV